MPAAFPTTIPTETNPTDPPDLLSTVSVLHTDQHAFANDNITALATKLGIGASVPIVNSVLAGTGAGTSSYTNSPTLQSITVLGSQTVGGDFGITGALSVGGVSTLTGAVTAAGLITANGGITMGGTFTLGAHTMALASGTITGAPTWSSNQAITLSTAAQPNITSVGTLTSLTMGGTLTMGAHTLALASATVSGQPTWSSTQNMNISGSAGSATSASTLNPGRNINGVLFDGSANITVTAAAGTLTGTTLNSTVTASSLTSVGTLASLTMGGTLTMGANTLALASATVSGTPTWSSNQAITLSTASQPNVTSVGTLTSLTTSGTFTMTAAASKLVPGATSFSLRNNADNADNMLVSNAGGFILRGATGGDQGAGTLNATGLYVNGTAVQAGSPALTVIGPAFCSANTTMTNAAQWYTPTGGSLGTALTNGKTYLLMGYITLTGATNDFMGARLWDVTNSVEIATVGYRAQNANRFTLSIPPIKYSGFSGTPTIAIQGQDLTSAGGVISAPTDTSTGNTGTMVMAVQIS